MSIIEGQAFSHTVCSLKLGTTATAAVPDRDFIRVGKSRIAGTGIFAKRRIHWGARVIEYIGKRLLHSELMQEIAAGRPESVYLFKVHAGVSIDGAIGGNESRFINHSCEPNCEANVFDDRVYIYALRDIRRGEELTFDYQLRRTFLATEETDSSYLHCLCGAATCRGTMMAPVNP